ncbi:MAG: DUF2007 domain-containing protein [Bacteroidetes bacterium]|nr:DUF2007 domain-containing protein [Bacteroidota bacterium]MBL6943668.1 DUF2007 domain-containing protein [Bacteroidales bacterium]
MTTNSSNNKTDKIIEIFSGNLWEAELIKSLLEDSKIRSFLKNNVLSSYAYDPAFSEGVKVMISNSDSPKAQEIVDAYFRGLNDEE